LAAAGDGVCLDGDVAGTLAGFVAGLSTLAAVATFLAAGTGVA